MNDLELARMTLEENNLTLVAVRDGKVIFASQDRGIKPMYNLLKEKGALAKDSVIADKVIGKGAALLCVHIGIKKLYTNLISQSARQVLEIHNIDYEFKNSCQYIKNRDETGYCPIEEMSMDIKDPVVLLDKLDEFLKS